ncbi:shikimate dehydrogenase [Adhaeribacter sp. BT258]|uniref:Shikimate dehydrogenase n=1 Tax=Adhaeribacter terrigena TaxID=2793070 RepID=A0ABS1BXF8_9BACT|nr:shikimate dehydrogenase [Adhaeribacter terrigena]MBK0401572.1 shikimate dehydrogenase [Adhaeribacter terrigena]
MRRFGLIGYPLGHSFSGKYFTAKFLCEGITDAGYELFELPDIADFPAFLRQNPGLKGLNVTIPHKQTILPFLNEIDPVAAKIGAINTVKITNGKCTGFNTDYIGFRDSLQNFLQELTAVKALILGTGGASKAVQAALQELHIPFKIVSRNPENGQLSYAELGPEIMETHQLIINTTPLGTFPNTETCPEIPYQNLTAKHYLYDLVYNPEETLFMKNAMEKGAKTKNGYEMLVLQAEAAWQIWNS